MHENDRHGQIQSDILWPPVCHWSLTGSLISWSQRSLYWHDQVGQARYQTDWHRYARRFSLLPSPLWCKEYFYPEKELQRQSDTSLETFRHLFLPEWYSAFCWEHRPSWWYWTSQGRTGFYLPLYGRMHIDHRHFRGNRGRRWYQKIPRLHSSGYLGWIPSWLLYFFHQ